MAQLQLLGAPRGVSHRVGRSQAFMPACNSLQPRSSPMTQPELGRRDSITGLLALSAGLLLQGQQAGVAAAAGKAPTTQVGAYLPKDEAAGDGFVRYTPDSKKTPVGCSLGVSATVEGGARL